MALALKQDGLLNIVIKFVAISCDYCVVVIIDISLWLTL